MRHHDWITPRVTIPTGGSKPDSLEEFPVHVLIVTFSLAGLNESDYRQLATDLMPTFTQVPGLLSKTWLADAELNTYGGVYFFVDAASL